MQLLINLRPVTEQGPGASFSVTGEADLPPLILGDEEFRPLAPAHYDLTFTNAGECVHTSGTVTLETRAVCARCLRDFDLPLTAAIEEVFYREPTCDEHGEQLPVIGDDGKIDLVPLLRESLLVEAPFAPLHDPACRGLCAGCGADLNCEPCTCVDTPDPTHPLAALRDLVSDKP